MANSSSAVVGVGLSCSSVKLPQRPISQFPQFSRSSRRFCCVKMAVSLDEKKNFTLKKSEEAFNAAKVFIFFPIYIYIYCLRIWIWRWVLVDGFDRVKKNWFFVDLEIWGLSLSHFGLRLRIFLGFVRLIGLNMMLLVLHFWYYVWVNNQEIEFKVWGLPFRASIQRSLCNETRFHCQHKQAWRRPLHSLVFSFKKNWYRVEVV